jgi:hypothetical protein
MNTSLRRHQFDENTMKGWKSSPLRIIGATLSLCHQKPTFVVQAMTGGFVTADCSECGKTRTITFDEFRDLKLWVACPSCEKQMSAEMVPPKDKNYGFICKNCNIYIWLSDLLPYCQDII